MSTSIHFYFDYLSPYALLGWEKGKKICALKNWELRAKPVVFGALLDKWGHKGPAEIPGKREFVFRDIMRKSAAFGLKLEFPQYHPFNPITALRLSLSEVSGVNQEKVIDAIWNAGWIRGEDIGSTEVVVAALERAGLPGKLLFEKTSDPVIKTILKTQTDRAIELGMFGVPTMMVNGELFWGEDQWDAIERFIEGRDLLDRASYEGAVRRPRGIDRKKAAT